MPTPYKVIAGPPVVAPPTAPEGSGPIPASGSAFDAPPPCSKCGGPHPFDTSVNSEQWNAVIRGGGLPDYLCLYCIIEAFAEAGQGFEAQLYSERLGGEQLRFVAEPPIPSWMRIKKQNTDGQLTGE